MVNANGGGAHLARGANASSVSSTTSVMNVHQQNLMNTSSMQTSDNEKNKTYVILFLNKTYSFCSVENRLLIIKVFT